MLATAASLGVYAWILLKDSLAVLVSFLSVFLQINS